MSYGMAAALQTAIYDALLSDAALADLVGGAIYDAIPAGTLPSLYVALGAETARTAHDKTGAGALHTISVEVVTDVPGFAAAKEAAGAISDVLHDADLVLGRGRLVYLKFASATASHPRGISGRTIDLKFRARTEDD
ncbi:MAG: DUF3168 domain-containing protein [Pseudomonadota bacterium]